MIFFLLFTFFPLLLPHPHLSFYRNYIKKTVVSNLKIANHLNKQLKNLSLKPKKTTEATKYFRY